MGLKVVKSVFYPVVKELLYPGDFILCFCGLSEFKKATFRSF